MQLTTSVRRASLVALAIAGFAVTGSAQTVSVSSQVLTSNPSHSSLPVGADNTSGLEYVGFVSVSDASPLFIQYTQAGDTIDVSQWVVSGAERGAGQALQVNGYPNVGSTPNLFLQGEPDINNPGFGAHANWIVTVDLNEVRNSFFAGNTTDAFTLEGVYGTWGGIQGAGASDGVTQGVIFLDGTRIDTMGQTVANPDGSEVNQPFDLIIPAGAEFLSFGIFNGNDGQNNNTVWDDAVYRDVNLTLVPEPASLALVGLAGGLLLSRRRR